MDPVEFRRIAQAGKDVDPAWYRVHRRLSIHLTRAALALGMSANQASLGMMAAGLVGAALLVPAAPLANGLGFAVLYLAFLLDKVDGELARLQGTQNAQGIFLDRMHHRLVEPCLFLAVALHEYLKSGSIVPLVAGFVAVLLANAIEENQHLAAYILYKRVREGDRLPDGVAPAPSPAWTRAAAWLRPLKGFRMFIVALPLFALAYLAEGLGRRTVPTAVLVAAGVGLAVYLGFQCLYYLRGQLDAESHAIAGVLRRSLTDGDDLMKHSTLRYGSLVLVVAALVAAAILVPGPASAAGTYYVDGASPACSNSGPGTPGVPYCTITAALAAQAGPGTTLVIAPGTYPEQVTVPASGAAGSPLVLQGNGTSTNPVIIEGGDSFANPGLWVPATGTTWLAASVTWDALMVLVDGQRLVPWLGAPDSVPVNGFRVVPGVGLYANLGFDGLPGNPGRYKTIVARRNRGIFISNRGWVTVHGITVRETNDRGIYVNGSHDIVVEDNVVEWVQRFGIQAQNSTNVLIRRNRLARNGDHGIALTAGTTASTVEDNESHHNARPGVRSANGIYLFGAPKNVFRRNRLHDNQDTGLDIQSGSDSCLSVQNMSWANGDHGFDHVGVTGSVHVGDVSYGNALDGFSFEGNAPGHRMSNCISVANGLGVGRYNLFADSSSATGHVFDDNIYWNPNGQPPVKFYKTIYPNVAQYSSATGQDTRTINADPRFVAPAEGDFHLLFGSPAIDAANTALPEWPGSDAEGFAPVDDPATANTGLGPVAFADRGAFEFGSGGVVDVPAPPAVAVIEGVTPNPLPATGGRLAFTTSRPGPLAVDLFDARGRHVRRLVALEAAPAGAHVATVTVDGGDAGSLPAGLYLYRVRSVDGERGGKFVVVR